MENATKGGDGTIGHKQDAFQPDEGQEREHDAIGSSVNDMRVPPASEIMEVQGSDELSKTFIFGNEDHTLGNSLRHVLMQSPKVDFCGYSVPHPYEPKMNMRLQTRREPAVNVMREGLNELSGACDKMHDAFEDAIKVFKTNQPRNDNSNNKNNASKSSKKRTKATART